MIHDVAEPVASRPELLRAEWERVELLGHCLALGRRGQEVSGEALSRLEQLQTQIEVRRAEAWSA
ncbi:MAG: hypothetical protein ABUT39_12665, partial [Acidobacteriota bacterium]